MGGLLSEGRVDTGPMSGLLCRLFSHTGCTSAAAVHSVQVCMDGCEGIVSGAVIYEVARSNHTAD